MDPSSRTPREAYRTKLGREMATKPKKPPTKGNKPSKTGGSSSRTGKKVVRSPKSETSSKGKSASEKPLAEAGSSKDEPRHMGIRGAAPWAARHAEKHREEARARAAEPPLPGSARATLRVPTGAEEIKARIASLHNILQKINTLRKNYEQNFFAIGKLLRDIRDSKLYEVHGFGSFEAFVEREVKLGKTTSIRLARVTEVFQEQAAISYGVDLVLQALATLESGKKTGGTNLQPFSVGASPPPLPMRPPLPKK